MSMVGEAKSSRFAPVLNRNTNDPLMLGRHRARQCVLLSDTLQFVDEVPRRLPSTKLNVPRFIDKLKEALIFRRDPPFSTVRGSGWPRLKTRHLDIDLVFLSLGHPPPRTVLNNADFRRFDQSFLKCIEHQTTYDAGLKYRTNPAPVAAKTNPR